MWNRVDSIGARDGQFRVYGTSLKNFYSKKKKERKKMKKKRGKVKIDPTCVTKSQRASHAQCIGLCMCGLDQRITTNPFSFPLFSCFFFNTIKNLLRPDQYFSYHTDFFVTFHRSSLGVNTAITHTMASVVLGSHKIYFPLLNIWRVPSVCWACQSKHDGYSLQCMSNWNNVPRWGEDHLMGHTATVVPFGRS